MTPLIPTCLTVAGVAWAYSGTLEYEGLWRDSKDYPQYKYIARPVYKFVASNSNTIIATAASFFVTDLIVHQLLPSTAKCILSTVVDCSCDISWSPAMSLSWVSFALPVMYAKYKNSGKT